MSNKIVKFTELFDCPRTLIADDLVSVNSDGTGLDLVTPSSLINGAVGSGLNGDIATFTGGVPVLQDSGLNISTTFNTVNIKPASNLNSVRLDSDLGVNIGSSITPSTLIDADHATGNISITSASQQMIAFNTITISGNNGVSISGAGGQSMALSNTGIDVTTQPGAGLRLFVNGMTIQFQPGSTGNYLWPLTDGLNGAVLTTDGNGVLSWVGGA